MPLFKIETNVSIDDEVAVAKNMATMAAEMLGKPQGFVLTICEGDKAVLFGGTDEPAAYVVLDSLGLPEEKTPDFSALICTFLDEHLGVPSERVFIAFGSPERHMFGWNGKTF